MKSKIICLLVFQFFGCLMATQAQTTVEKLIAHYTFDGNARDVSGNNYHASVNGAVLTTDRFGNPNSAYYFDGVNDNIILPSSFDLRPKTISFWFNAFTIDNYSRVIYVSDNPNLNYGITAVEIKKIAGIPKIATHITSSRDTAEVTANTWYNFTITINTDSTHFYLNGEKLKSRKITSYPKSNTGVAQTIVGSHRQGNTNSIYFHGKIDDVKIYNRELTQAEISTVTRSQLQITQEDFCLKEGGSQSLYVPGFVDYKWSNGSTSSVAMVREPGKYSLTAKDSNGNLYFGEIEVVLCPKPDFKYTFDCETNSFKFEPVINFDYDRFHWKYDGLTVRNVNSPTHQFSAEGQQLVALNVYSRGVELIVTKYLTFTRSVDPYLGRDTALCIGQSLTLAPELLPNTALKWSDGSTGATLTVAEPGTYWAEATRGDCTLRDEIVVGRKESFPLTLGNDTTLCTGQSLTLDPKLPDTIPLQWYDDSGNPISSDRTLTVTKPGKYRVTAFSPTCAQSTTIQVDYIECYETLEIPNIITPNSDQLNDAFVIKNLNLSQKNQLKVFNRWGQVLYASEDYRNDWAPNNISGGLYYYQLREGGSNKVYKGWLEVVF